MPALPASLLESFVNGETISTFSLFPRGVNAPENATLNATANATINAPGKALQVICAWPVSGQYGPGSRILYYALIIACVVARHVAVIRDACTSAALLLPALAAIHGIALAALHRKGGVDMDIYGAFQLCSIGVLTCTLMVRRSGTYFNAPGGRNIVYLWTGLVLAGLLSLAVEFYRIRTTSCTHDDSFGAISNNPHLFPYNDNPNPTFCGILCNQNAPPYSPMRAGAQNNIYVIPAPNIFTFGQAMLFSAACCIPAILSLVAYRNQIKEFDWRKRSGGVDKKEEQKEHTKEKAEAPISGLNGAANATTDTVVIEADTKTIEKLMKLVEIPVFSSVILAILVIGEINLWSVQVKWQTEPISTVGQWAPIVGTILALAGSAYVIWKGNTLNPEPKEPTHQCDCPNHRILSIVPPTENSSPDDTETQRVEDLTPAVGVDFDDDGDFRGGLAQVYPETPSERFKNNNYTEHVERYHIIRRGPGGDTSPHPRDHSRANSFVNGEESISPSIRPVQRQPSLQVPPVVHPGCGRSNSDAISVVSVSSQTRDDLGISIKPDND